MLIISDVHQDNGADWYEEGIDYNLAFHLTLITYGKCVYWINHEKVIVEKGDLLLIPGHIPYYGKSIPTVVHTKFVVNFKKTDIDARLPILQLQDPLKQKLGCYEIIHERLRGMLGQWKDRPHYYEMMAEAMLTEALIYLNQERDRGVISSEKHRRIESMKQYIQLHYRKKVTKEELGDVIHTTPNYAATLFKAVTNQTISEYVHLLRMKTAVYMLTESELTISEISDFLGYSDVSYFHRIFKRNLGGPPSEFL